jgi:fructose-bisphosphate aldolase class II
MEIVTLQELLADASRKRYAVGAFNVSNLESVRSVLEAAEETASPVVLQAASEEVKYAGGRCLVAMIEELAASRRLRLGIHLDHGPSFEFAMLCLRYGFTSVMFDGSRLPYEQNVETTRRVVEAAGAAGVSVEGELGTIGSTTEMGERIDGAYLTDPQQAGDFVRRTRVHCLAPAFGTAHGLYRFEPRLDFERLARIRESAGVPLAMHGGTGVPAEQIRHAIELGVAKINFSTILRKSFIDRMREYMSAHPEDLMTMNILGQAALAMKQSVKDMIMLCGSASRY